MHTPELTTESPPKPFPSLTQGVLQSTDPLAGAENSVNRAVHVLTVVSCQSLIALVRAVARLLSLLGSERQELGKEMLFTSALLQAASWAVTTARHVRSMVRRQAAQAEICYLLRQTEATSIQVAAWLAIAKPTPFESVLLTIVQALTFFLYLLVTIALPSLGHVITEFLAEVARRRYLFLQFRLPLIPAWRDGNITHLPVYFWYLPEHATIKELFEALQQDMAYIAMVNSAITAPQRSEDLPSLLSPAKPLEQPCLLSPQKSRINPLYGGGTLLESPEEMLQGDHSRPSSSRRQSRSGKPSTFWNGTPELPQGSSPQGASSRSGRATESLQRSHWRQGSTGGSETQSVVRRLDDDDAISVAGSAVSQVKEPAEVLEEMDKMWAQK